MRIGFDSKRLYCNFTGLGNYSRALVKNVQALYLDNEYFLYSPKIKKTPETNFFYNNSSFKTYLAKTVFKAYWRSFSISSQLKKDGIQLYHGLSNELPVNLKKYNIKSVVTIHDLIFKILPETYPLIDRNIYDFKFRKACLLADKVIAISNSTKTDIVNFYGINPDKIEVVYQSCSPLFYEPIEHQESNSLTEQYKLPNHYILSVGSVEKRKNLKLIIEAYQYLDPDHQVPLVVIGRGKTYKKEVLDLIASNELEKKVIWITNLKDNKVLRAIYQKASALVYPSFYEGFGLPIVEAMLSKTPVITSNVSSLPEAGGPNSLYINPSSSEELANAITQVLTNSELVIKMIEEGFKYANQMFSPNRVSKQLINCYEEILNE
jgi:glycosyltransferase involved in cell wall biosynthesis